MATRFKEINPATNKVWKLAEMHAALIESQVQVAELRAVANCESELSWNDVQKRFIMPRVKKDMVERPLFFKDARCGYQSLVQWIKEGYTELRKPLFN